MRPVLLRKKPVWGFLQPFLPRMTTAWPYWFRRRVLGEPHFSEYVQVSQFHQGEFGAEAEDLELLK